MNNYLHFLFWHGRFNCLEHRNLYPLLKRQPFTIVCFASLLCLNQESFNLRPHHFCEIYINIAHYRTYALQSEKLRTFSSVLISKFLALLSSGDSIENVIENVHPSLKSSLQGSVWKWHLRVIYYTMKSGELFALEFLVPLSPCSVHQCEHWI